ncbi:MAG: hypothetical protein KA165_05865 [Saprospiraceae bacterium]|nr:hypothetical protein [Saprospiraceae bacterium]
MIVLECPTVDKQLPPTSSIFLESVASRDRYDFINSSSILISRSKTLALNPNNRRIIQKLNSFDFLLPNWDSYNAEKPSQKAIEEARQFVYHLNYEGVRVYFTAPGRKGEILLELKNDTKAVEIYFYEDSKSDYFLFEQNTLVGEGSTRDGLKNIIDFIN